MKFNHSAFIVFAAILSIFTADDCNSKSSVLNFLPAILSKGIEKKESFRLSPNGTQYTGSEELSFLSIDFPEFAVEQADVVEVASYKKYSKSIGNIDIVKAFSIRPAKQDIFRKPVSVTVTLDAMPEKAMPFYADDHGYLWPMIIKERNNQSITFYTQHASDFLITEPPAGWDAIPFFDTFFDPKVDGFQIDNFRDKTNPETGKNGVCGGMSMFAIEYFNKYKKIDGGLYNNFTKKLPEELQNLPWYSIFIHDDDLIEQHLIASYMQYLLLYMQYDLLEEDPLADNYCPYLPIDISSAKDIASYIYATKSPQLLNVCGGGEVGKGCHAVVAFKYNLLNNSVTIYDPNHHGVESEWIFGTLPSFCQEFGWTSIRSIRILTGSYQEAIEAVAQKVYQDLKNSDVMKIAVSKVHVTSPPIDDLTDYYIEIDENGYSHIRGFYVRGSIDKDQIFPPERITFNIYNGREQVICLAQYYDQWDISYIYDDIPDKSITVDVDPTTGSFEAVLDFNLLNRMEKLEAVAHVTVGGEDIELKTNIWKSDGTAINFDTHTKKILDSNMNECIQTWCPPGRRGNTCWR
jgi:hypothetical protein